MLVAVVVCHTEVGRRRDRIGVGQVDSWAVTEFDVDVEFRPAKLLLVDA